MIDFSTFLKDKDNFRFQLIVSYVVLAILLLTFTVLLQVYLSMLQDDKNFEQNIQSTAEKKIKYLTQYINNNKSQITAIANSPLVLTAIKNKDYKYLEQYLFDKISANTDYMRIRYIQNTGLEIISINRTEKGQEPHRVDSVSMNTKIEQNDFSEILNTDHSSVWFSSIEPIFKIGIPLYNHKKEPNGVIIIDLFIKDFITDLFSEQRYDSYFVDEQGYYIIHPNSQKNWSRYYSHRTLKDDFSPQLGQIIETQKPLYFNEDHIFVVPFYVHNNKYTMIFTQKKSELIKKRENGLTILYTILAVIFISSFLFAKLFSKPFDTAYKRLSNEAESLNQSTIALNQRIVDEIEKNKRQELILQHQSKLSALGELLSAITHQWKHPITRISLLLQNLRLSLRMTDKLDANTDSIMHASFEQIDFLSETIENFKNFYKFDEKKESFTLQEALSSVVGIMCDIFDFHMIKLDINLDDSIKIYGNKVAFSHVFLNIMNNAKDEIVQRKVKNPIIHIVSRRKGNRVSLFIYDNAGGVQGASPKEIFNPYVSTKAKEGSGMGLYIARAIIEEKFKGTIVARNIDNGLLFKISLGPHVE